jgi:hypothetical protein
MKKDCGIKNSTKFSKKLAKLVEFTLWKTKPSKNFPIVWKE